MTGPWHFTEAERLLTVCAGDQRGTPLDIACTAAAQVHATLAMAAAIALPDAITGRMREADCDAWEKAAG